MWVICVSQSCVCSAISRVELVNLPSRYRNIDDASVIEVRKTGSNDWFLDKIILTDLSTNRSQDFFCYCWLSDQSRISTRLQSGEPRAQQL